MRLLLTSFLHDRLPEYLGGRVAYVDTAARATPDAPFAQRERAAVEAVAREVLDLPVVGADARAAAQVLAGCDAVYVAGGETFTLLDDLRTSGLDRVLTDAARGGLTYVSSSAGSLVAGPSVEPAAALDDPGQAPGLSDYRGLGLTQWVVLPHAQGSLPPYPIDAYAHAVADHGRQWPLLLLRDGQALLVDDDGDHLV